MRTIRLCTALVGVIVVLGILVSPVAARRIAATSETLRATFRELTFAGGFGSMTCGLTLEGSLHSRTITKTIGALIGYITRAIYQKPCSRGDATVLTESLPWHIQYGGFTGTLPAINSIRKNIIGVAITILEPVFGISCLLRSTAANPVIGTYSVSAGVLTSATLGGRIPTSCGLEGEFRGTSTSLTVLGGTSRISVTLI